MLPGFMSGVVSLWNVFREYGMTSLPELSGWAIALFALLPISSWAIIGLLIRVVSVEKRLEPKILLSGPEITMKPGDQGYDITRYSLKITNTSSNEIKNVQLKMISFINANGKQTNHLNARFRWSTEQTHNLQEFAYSQSITIAAKDSELFDIAEYSENQIIKTNNHRDVLMLYATPANTSYGNCICTSCFPHELIVRATASGVADPIDKSFKLFFDEGGVLKMEVIKCLPGNT